MLSVRAATPVRPSEDVAKVEKAIRTLFPEASLALEGGRLRAETRSLKALRDLIWKQKILDAARRIFLGSLSPDGREARFSLNKQAAYVGGVSFGVGEPPLGDIEVHARGEDLEARFKEMAPPTLRGRPVSEEEYARHLEKKRKKRASQERLTPALLTQEEEPEPLKPQGEEE